MKVENIYISAGCNRTPACLDWGKNGLIAYGANSSICLLDPNFHQSAKIIQTLAEHKKPVNCLKWVRGDNEMQNFLISGGNDGLAIVWNIENFLNPYHIVLEGHSCAIYVVDAIHYNSEIVAATASADSSIRLWRVQDKNNVQCFQIIHLSKGFSLSISLSVLPDYNRLVLAEASDDNKIVIWVESKGLPENYQLEKLHSLKGHEDWVRGLDFITTVENELMLCSSSQDSFIRIWKIAPRKTYTTTEMFTINSNDDEEIKIEENLFSIGQADCKVIVAISVESVLQGHENWVYGVHWHKDENGSIKLLSASMDKTLVIWEFDPDMGVWLDRIRLGEVGGNSLGFFGGKISLNGKSVIGHSFQGGLHIWNQSECDPSIWEPGIIVSGHFNEVRDLCWEPSGEFLFSTSADQTTRIHAPFKKDSSEENITWHELSRPQVHGYDMQTITVINRYKFASGAEEKIVRVFQSTADFIQNFRKICKIKNDSEGDKLLNTLPKGASVPSLGLSNKAVYNCEENLVKKHVKDEYPENYYVSITLETPPQEETLMQNSLWPEIHKLYGHGFEIFALTCSPNSKWLASSCKASSAEHAYIILWDAATGKQIQKLASHQLTVTQLKFSPNNQYLLSVSRDRSWTIFKNVGENVDFQLEAKSDKTNGIHTRIIWSCDWSHDSIIFGTASRDGKIVLWSKESEIKQSSIKNWSSLASTELKGESVTALCFAPCFFEKNSGIYLLAIGLEIGQIKIYKFSTHLELVHTVPKNLGHQLTVKKLAFNPRLDRLLLASCGEDQFVRIIELKR